MQKAFFRGKKNRGVWRENVAWKCGVKMWREKVAWWRENLAWRFSIGTFMRNLVRIRIVIIFFYFFVAWKLSFTPPHAWILWREFFTPPWNKYQNICCIQILTSNYITLLKKSIVMPIIISPPLSWLPYLGISVGMSSMINSFQEVE